MDEVLKTLNGLEIVYLFSAITGGLFFFVRLVMMVVGFGDHDGGLDHDGGFDGDAGFDGDGGGDVDAHHADSDMGFKVLTIQGLTAFFMMFGLVGFALYREIGSGAPISVIGATGAGMATVWVIGKVFSSMRKLQSSGTVDHVSAIGGEGSVYLTIPKGGTGRVQVSFKNRFREYDATAQDKKEIRTGERVRVVWADGNHVVVEKID